ncbi:hypothetical protein [Oceanidesulfovibrio marinus]|uniref:Membrane domain of glycerophosphoryl diester phosphodiesterase n=1 Tax=Oceanidesulfovibrio marinus TaxID=370038 RepID=A0A6P1ZHK9_9BACT|nr:hypothetical protein [Oceanidesulfovibrio marinus]TVM34650.1 hypothetical protein DQK91_08755 [Oceanidesulfovibrio marinus]
MQYRVGEFGVGQLLDVAFNVFKDNYKPMLIVAVLAFLPVTIITVAVLLGGVLPMYKQLLMFNATGAMPDPTVMFATMAPFFAAVSVLGILWYLTTIISEGAITFVTASSYLDNPVAPREALRYCFSRWWALLKTALLIALIFIGILFVGGILVALAMGGISLIAGGLVGGLISFVLIVGLFLAAIMVFLRYFLALKIVILEGVAGREALGRSAFLMKGTYGRAFILLLLLGVVSNIIGTAANLIPFVPVAIVLSIALQVAIYVYTTSVWTMFYFSNRCKHENFDLVLLAEEAE